MTLKLDPNDRIFLNQISKLSNYAECSWTKPHTERLIKLGYVKAVTNHNGLYAITAAGKDAIK